MNLQVMKRKVSIGPKVMTLAAFLVVVSLVTAVQATEITVMYENLAPADGVYTTPVWVGVHDGGFDLFDPGSAASAGLEAAAEDGDFGALAGEFAAAAPGGVGMVITGPGGAIGAPPVFDPGESNSITFDVDGSTNRYLNFMSMIIPSNDAFIGNGMPLEIFNPDGSFKGKQIITVLGSMVWDAGTEDNTEMDAAFINQAAADTGITTINGVVDLHEGFIGSLMGPAGDSIILGGSNGLGAFFDPVGADFTLKDAVVARVTVIPEPATMALLGVGGITLLRRRRAA